MPVNVTYLGHSGFLLDDGKCAVAVDPFLTGNPLAQHKPADIKCQYVALTHGHADHLGDTAAIAKANGATLIAVFEVCEFLVGAGVTKTEPGNTGGTIPTEFGSVTFVQAFHSSNYQGRYMGAACGLVIRIGGVTFYHCGDTALFSDLKLIGDLFQPDVAAIPVGDRFTMGPEHAARAAELIRPRVAIPIHYKTFPLLAQDISKFAPAGVEVNVLAPGQSHRYG